MYPDNQKITMNGEEINWPGVDAGGKFTNGNFSDPVAQPPSFIPAETINLILDNMASLITSLGGSPNNRDISQLDIVKTYIDSLKTAIDGSIAAHIGNTGNPHGVTKAQLGLGNVENAALSTHTGNTGNPHGVTKAQVGLSNVANTAQVTNVAWSSNKLTKTINGSTTDIVTAATLKTALGVSSATSDINSTGHNYMRFNNGWQIVLGAYDAPANSYIITLPVSFTSNAFTVVSTHFGNNDAWQASSAENYYAYTANTIRRYKTSTTSFSLYIVAIGSWK